MQPMTPPTPAPIRIEDALGVCGVREDTRMLAETAAGSPPGRALDVGTGSGYVGIYLAQRGWVVDAVDISPRALDLAQRNAAANGVTLRLYASDLFEALDGRYDVIAFNPPMRADESESSRLLTSTLRRIPPLANLLMRVTQPMLERKRLGFLADVARRAQGLLLPHGRLLLVISPLEEAELPKLVAGLVMADSRPVRTIPGLSIVSFRFEEPA
jgi:SAM-dependent methyltransferase